MYAKTIKIVKVVSIFAVLLRIHNNPEYGYVILVEKNTANIISIIKMYTSA